ncbi:DNA repair protein RadA, partial [filamentous cyanobacterium CCP3]
MAKSRSIFVCNECGAESPQYFGRCPVCNSWNSLVEQAQPAKETAVRASALGRSRGGAIATKSSQPRLAMTLNQIQDHPQARLPSGYGELDRVLGGGIVPGSLVLLGGDPGIGKSTLLLQVANQLAARQRVLYVCAEESGQQVKLRWQRLGPIGSDGVGGSGSGSKGKRQKAKNEVVEDPEAYEAAGVEAVDA